jgi:hypothetical protein
MTGLAYVMKTLGVTTRELLALSDEDKADLRKWAAEEQAAIAAEKQAA